MVVLGQTTNGNDRSRTYWTPAMERYFIDLMLDQMRKGARIGHTFNKQAWTEMLAVFNGKFGSQYDKDVLKSRYTNLWKQFNDAKSLLARDGFSWDEARQMVVADECHWDSYIKAHPEARSYKTKPVLNFNDLCLIYGYTTADGRYSRSSHDIDFDDEIRAMTVGDGTYSVDSSNNGRQRTDWTPEMDHYFIELMLDQVGRCNKHANTFNKQAWADMIASFNAKFGPQHGKRVLRHRHKKLSKYYSDVTLLLKQDGFSWSETQRMVVADDQVWDTYTKTHPHARSYRTKALPNYYDLILIFGNGFDNGLNTCSNPEQNLRYDVAQLISVEGKGSPADRTRTYWTPPMDRYLVDLLLDHVHRGNKLGQTFTSQAWAEMAASFNAQFKSFHDKDVLKNRYKHLRRQYNDIKLLLEQNGFSWDEAREMISAEDHVWDAYTKAHPDARTYRVKAFPSFHKLCAIFGEEQSDGRYSRLARDADLVCELPELITGEERNVQSTASALSSRINWTPHMDFFLIDLMSQQVREGRKIDDTFDEQAWLYMLDSFNKNYGLRCNNKSFLEDRYVWLKKQYESIDKLLSCSGFMWDETRQMVIAGDDVWEAYIEEHPEAVSYRNTCLSSYRDLHKIFRTGETVESINGQLADMIFDDQGFEMIRDCHIPETSSVPSSLELEAEGFSLPLLSEDVCLSEKQKKRTASRPVHSGSGHCRKVQKTDSENMQTLSEVADIVAELVSKNEKKNDHPMVSAIDALQAIPDVEDDLLLDACDLLEDERKAKTFLALDTALRKKWLLRKLRPQL